MKTTLVIMAAGIGSRYGGGIKQLAPVGLNDEIIMDYSVFDAMEAGFNKIIFIIRKDIEAEFKEVIGSRMEKICRERNVELCYVYQSLEDLPKKGRALPAERKKPWGTGQAVLACRDLINEPFAVINADDYYGKKAFRDVYAFLQEYSEEKPFSFCMAGFLLKNTLSENGGVTRGICRVDNDGNLLDITETSNVLLNQGVISADGKELDGNSFVSMNMWGLTPGFMDKLEKGFADFFERMKTGDAKSAEFLLPVFIGELLAGKEASVKVLETKDKWFGVTYKEDRESVSEAFRQLIEDGVYKEKLFDDIGK